MIFHPETQKHLMYLKHHLDWKNNDVDAFLTMVLMGAYAWTILWLPEFEYAKHIQYGVELCQEIHC